MRAVEKFFAVFLGELPSTAVTERFKEDGEAHNVSTAPEESVRPKKWMEITVAVISIYFWPKRINCKAK